MIEFIEEYPVLEIIESVYGEYVDEEKSCDIVKHTDMLDCHDDDSGNVDMPVLSFNENGFYLDCTEESPIFFSGRDVNSSHNSDHDVMFQEESHNHCEIEVREKSNVFSVMSELGMAECVGKRPSNCDSSTANAFMDRTMQFMDPFFSEAEWDCAMSEAMSMYWDVPKAKKVKNRCRAVWRIIDKCNELIGEGVHRAVIGGSLNGLTAEATQKMLALQILLRNLPGDRSMVLEQALMVCAAIGESDPHRRLFT
eukprot:TRINITY_DN6067_c0_g2_i1.p1 TRINITY_DN6067_c0_g2~~TRINITY_DN6067_c0_g2_i1.p1  ORF type:complete len:253 (-),score=58.07 TRINITY_DN6067_c0_g2_i1:991-1749(-)